jgi:predicted dithiol-disulfide oxidoreductase (DUF899 family)
MTRVRAGIIAVADLEVRIDKEYRFQTDEGTASLAGLFAGRSQLLVYHFMFGAAYTAGCAPLGRNENGFWWRRHDEYDGQ